MFSDVAMEAGDGGFGSRGAWRLGEARRLLEREAALRREAATRAVTAVERAAAALERQRRRQLQLQVQQEKETGVPAGGPVVLPVSPGAHQQTMKVRGGCAAAAASYA